MTILLIPDKFKGSLNAKELIEALTKGINKANSNHNIISVIASDGGDGFLHAVSKFENLEFIEMLTVNSIGQSINSKYAYNSPKKTAYIELAKASGLDLLPKENYNVLKGSTFGTGLQIKEAVKRGATKIFIGLGGSATNDGGIGIASALGYKFLDDKNGELNPTAENLPLISKIMPPKNNLYKQIAFYAVNDVTNRLFGKEGAAYVYAKQKGASDNEIVVLDAGLKQLNSKVITFFGKDFSKIEGTGAAGGAAYGLKVFFEAEFISGIDFILNQQTVLQSFNQNNIDLIITGEGQLDQQTLHGKLVCGVAIWSEKRHIPVVAICGKNTLSNKSAKTLNLLKIIETSDSSKLLEHNMKYAATLVEKAIFEFIKQYKPKKPVL